MPTGARAAMIDLKKKFDSNEQSLANLPLRGKAIIDALKATKKKGPN